MNIALCIVSILFGGLSLLAAIVQIIAQKKAMPAIFMIAGSVVLICAAICNFAGLQFDFVLALVGCGAICFAAVLNGLKSGNFHVQHHIIRIAVSVILTIGFILL